MALDLDTTLLARGFNEVFWNFCAEKKVSDKNIAEVLDRAVSELAHNLGLEVKIEPERPTGIKAMLEPDEEFRNKNFLEMARHCPI